MYVELILMYDLTSAKIVIVFDFIASLNFVNILKLGQFVPAGLL